MTNDSSNTIVTFASTLVSLNLPAVKNIVELMRSNARQQQTLQTSRPVDTPAPFPYSNAPLPTMPKGQRNTNMEALVAAVASVAASDAASSNSGPKAAPAADIPIIASVAAAAASVITPLTAIIVQVHHTSFNHTLYFHLSADITLEVLVKGLQISFQDDSISSLSLFYKRMDNTWQSLINPSGGDYLEAMLKQATDTKTSLQMKVVREQDLLSFGNVYQPSS